MDLKILLPFGIFAQISAVARIIAETRDGSFGLLPHRLDCVAALVPGILIYQTQSEAEVCLAIDEGVLVKSGMNVLVSVRNAMSGTDLTSLRQSVKQQFLSLNEQEKSLRSVMNKMETSFISRLAEFGHE